MRALRGLDRHAGGNARAWLLAITRNTAFTWLARNRSKALVISEDIDPTELAKFRQFFDAAAKRGPDKTG